MSLILELDRVTVSILVPMRLAIMARIISSLYSDRPNSPINSNARRKSVITPTEESIAPASKDRFRSAVCAFACSIVLPMSSTAV